MTTTQTAAQLRQQRAALVDEAQRIADTSLGQPLTPEQRKKFNDLYRQAEALNVQIAEAVGIETELQANIRTNPGKGLVSNFRDGLQEVRDTGAKRRVNFDPNALLRYMTPASNSAGKSAFTATGATQLQSVENYTWLDRLQLNTVDRNNTVIPYIARANRATAANKAYADEVGISDYVVSSTAIALKNYYVRLSVHGDVLRDAATADLEATLFNAAREDVLRQIAFDVLLGSGSSNNITGIANTANIQTFAHSDVIADYSTLTKAARYLMDTANVSDPGQLIALMHPKAWEAFANLQAGTDGQPLQTPPQIAGLSWYPYNRIPTNQGTGTDTSLYVFDPSKWTLHMENSYEISTNTGPGMTRDMVDIVVLMRAHLTTIDPASAVVVTGIEFAA